MRIAERTSFNWSLREASTPMAQRSFIDIAPVNICYDGDKYFLIDFEKCKCDMSDVVCAPVSCGCYKHKK